MDRRYRWSIFAVLRPRNIHHYSLYALNDVIHICEVTLAVAVVEDLNCLSLEELVGESEVSHVRSSGRSVHREKSKSCRRNVVQLAVGVGEKLIAFLGRCIQ